jgi:hypothetical protein
VATTVAPTPARRKRVPASIAVAVIVVVLAELALRGASAHIPPVLEWDNWQTQNKAAAMERLGAVGGASVVMVGSSMVNSGFDPDLFTQLYRKTGPADRRPAFNAALDGSNIHLTELWTLKVVVPRLKPRVVVIGMNSAELNENGVDAFENLFVDSKGWRDISGDGPTYDRLVDDFTDWLYLVRYRQVLRKPSGFFRTSPDRARGEVSRLGVPAEIKRFQTSPYAIKAGLRQVAGKIFYKYKVGQDRVAALGAMVDALVGQGIKVVLVRMPITADEIPFHPNGAADYARFVKVFDAFIEARPAIRYFDSMPLFPGTAYFRDPHHVNLAGKERLTRLIADVVAKL